jgi:hypothetical protein
VLLDMSHKKNNWKFIVSIMEFEYVRWLLTYQV